MVNLTGIQGLKLPSSKQWELTNGCIGWCRDQHYVFTHNGFVESLIILIVAFICFFIAYLILNYEFIRIKCKEMMGEKWDYKKSAKDSIATGMFLMGAFIIYFIYLLGKTAG